MGQITKEIHVITENRPGTLAKVAAPIKEAGVGITAACAWGEEKGAHFYFLTDNNGKAVEALKKAGLDPSEREVVTTTLTHKVGTLAEAAQKLGQAGVDIDYCYVTASGGSALAVFATKDNKKAASLI